MKAINAFLLIALIYAIGSADAQIRCLDYVPNFKGSYVSERSKGDNSAFSLDFCQSTYFESDIYYRVRGGLRFVQATRPWRRRGNRAAPPDPSNW